MTDNKPKFTIKQPEKPSYKRRVVITFNEDNNRPEVKFDGTDWRRIHLDICYREMVRGLRFLIAELQKANIAKETTNG